MAAKVLVFSVVFVVLKVGTIHEKNVGGIALQGYFDSLTLLAVLKVIVSKFHGPILVSVRLRCWG